MSEKGRSETWTRALTGAVFVVVVMGAVWHSPWSSAALWDVVATLALVEWFKAPKGPSSKWPKAMLFLFPVPALASLHWMCALEPYDPWPILSFVWMIWANDTGAYLVGKPFGKHKLAVGFAWQVVGGFCGGCGGGGRRGVGDVGFGVLGIGGVDGRLVDGRGLDPERVEAASGYERLGYHVAGTRRNPRSLRWIFVRNAGLCPSLLHFRGVNLKT